MKYSIKCRIAKIKAMVLIQMIFEIDNNCSIPNIIFWILDFDLVFTNNFLSFSLIRHLKSIYHDKLFLTNASNHVYQIMQIVFQNGNEYVN